MSGARGDPLISIGAVVVVLVLRWRLRPLGAPWGAFRGRGYPRKLAAQNAFLALPWSLHAKRPAGAAWPWPTRPRGRGHSARCGHPAEPAGWRTDLGIVGGFGADYAAGPSVAAGEPLQISMGVPLIRHRLRIVKIDSEPPGSSATIFNSSSLEVSCMAKLPP
jgi:hypothetical protein